MHPAVLAATPPVWLPLLIFGAVALALTGAGIVAKRIRKFAKLMRHVPTDAEAAMWRLLRDYLNSPPVSMPNDGELRSQLASVRYRYKNGLLLMQDKKTYKALFKKSPDRADAMVQRDDHRVATRRESLAVVRGGRSRTERVAAAVEPHEHRARAIVERRGPEVHHEAVLARRVAVGARHRVRRHQW